MTVSTIAEVLLADDEPPAVEIVRPTGTCPIVLVCDHASNRIPRSLGTLGLSSIQLQEHIAWDPGAALLARKLSARLGATLVLSNYSRLVIDCNRSPGHADSIPTQSDSIAIPANEQPTDADVERRRLHLFEPYHDAIASLLSIRNPATTRLLSIHSFTAVLAGQQRPWSIGVCYDHSKAWARQILRELRLRTEDQIGDNEPYAVEEEVDYTLPVQGERRGLPSVMLEVRQDKLRDEVAIQLWCNLIGDTLNLTT